MCLKCPKHAVCCGSWIIYPEPGFWRLNSRSENLIQCKTEASCKQVFLYLFLTFFIRGGINKEKTDINLMEFCDKGHTGALCDSCKDGYAKLGSKFFYY